MFSALVYCGGCGPRPVTVTRWMLFQIPRYRAYTVSEAATSRSATAADSQPATVQTREDCRPVCRVRRFPMLITPPGVILASYPAIKPSGLPLRGRIRPLTPVRSQAIRPGECSRVAADAGVPRDGAVAGAELGDRRRGGPRACRGRGLEPGVGRADDQGDRARGQRRVLFHLHVAELCLQRVDRGDVAGRRVLDH